MIDLKIDFNVGQMPFLLKLFC